MAIDPKKGGKCWSCKHCEDVGFQSEYDAVYVRKCTKYGKEYVANCTNYCSSYVWDGKDPEFNYTYSSSTSTSSSSSSSSSSSGGKAVKIIVGLLVAAAIGCYVYSSIVPDAFGGKSEEIVSQNEQRRTGTVTANKALNMREGPGESYEKLGTIPTGETVYIEKEENGWAYVEYNGQKGWCSLNYINVNE